MNRSAPAALPRRRWLAGVSASLLAPLLGSGLLTPRRALAAEGLSAAFTARSIGEALKAYGGGSAAESRGIVIMAPEIAENGAKVQVEITSHLADTRSLAIFAEKNPMPLCAELEFSAAALPFARIPLKLAETTRLRVLARTGDGKTHVAFRQIRVTLGGCGS